MCTARCGSTPAEQPPAADCLQRPLVPRIVGIILLLRHTVNARLMYTRREGYFCRVNVYRNAVQQSTSPWWGPGSFWTLGVADCCPHAVVTNGTVANTWTDVLSAVWSERNHQ